MAFCHRKGDNDAAENLPRSSSAVGDQRWLMPTSTPTMAVALDLMARKRAIGRAAKGRARELR